MVGLGLNIVSMFSLPLFFGSPEPQKMFKSMQEGIQALFKSFGNSSNYEKSLKKLGFPLQYANLTTAPFDVVSDGIRGMRGTMLDMYRKPEELKKMINMFIQPCINASVLLGSMYPHLKVVAIFLHRGADGFMSNEQFAEFYWPSLTKVMDELIKNGLIPMPFCEGGYNDRLDFLTEFAKINKGKLIFWFDKTDIVKAKEMLGDYACIRGNIPGSLLVTGTPQKIETYIKNSIENCAEGGGFLIDGGVSGIPAESRPENVKAMTDAVFKYGVYRK